MAGFTEQQLRQQWLFSQMTPDQHQQYRIRQAQRTRHQQSKQLQRQQQQTSRPPQQQNEISQGQLSPSQQLYVREQMQVRQQHDGQQRQNPMQFPVQSFNNTQLPGFHGMVPPSSPNHTGSSSHPQASPHYSPRSTVSSTNSLSGANILKTGNGQQQHQYATQSPPINGTKGSRPSASSPLSAPSTSANLPTIASPQNATMTRTPVNSPSPARHAKSPTLKEISQMPTLSLSMPTQSGTPTQLLQQVKASSGSAHSQQPRMSASNVARSQQSPSKQGQLHAQTKQQSSPTENHSPPLAHPTSNVTGRKRQATDAPDGTVRADKRQHTMLQAGIITHATPIRQNLSPSYHTGKHQRANGTLNGATAGVAANTDDANRARCEQQAKLEAKRRTWQQQAIIAERARAQEQSRVDEQYRVTHAAALQREKDDKRRAELRKDPGANFRHILEVYKLSPLKKGELPNRYLTGLLANRSMPMDLDCDLALAITYAKDHWDYYGQWPKDIKRFADYERGRRAKAKDQI